jgi:hypothetical protein
MSDPIIKLINANRENITTRCVHIVKQTKKKRKEWLKIHEKKRKHYFRQVFRVEYSV